MKLQQVFDGGCHYLYDTDVGPHRILLGLPCFVGELIEPHYALLDTASTWGFLPPATARDLGHEPGQAGPQMRMSTRMGLFTGSLERIPLRFLAGEGVPVTIEATWFISEDWPGPLVIGWKGGLERIRCTLDPSEEAFYFAEL